jgi:hypothetical protein
VGLPKAEEYVGFDFWANKFIAPFKESVRAELTAGSCRILAIQPLPTHPQLLSTSRHITQGMIDVTDEKWDARKAILSATSKVVADDPYELRIVLPVSEKSWRATGVAISSKDREAGVITEFKQDGPRLRVTMTSASSRDVKWRVQFAAGRVEAITPPSVTNLKAMAQNRRVSLSWDENGADSYRVTRGDGLVFTTMTASFVDLNAPRDQSTRYNIAAMGWNGAPSTSSTIEVQPQAQLKAPPTPPQPSVYLDDLKPVVRANGWGAAGVNKSVSGGPLSIGGKQYKKGLGLHAVAEVACPIPAGASRFVAIVGLDDAKLNNEKTSVTFEVYGDVKEMGEKPVLLGQSPVLSYSTISTWSFDVALNSRYKELRLVITDAGDGINSDHADWADAGFILANQKGK